ILMETESERDMIKKHVMRQQEAGMNAQFLSKKETRERQPGLADGVIAGTFCEDDASVNSMRISFAMAEAAKNLGATLKLGSKVKRLIVERGHVKGVDVSGEKIFADAVVLTTGIWTPSLVEPHGVDVPITPRRGQILVTEKIPPFLKSH